MSLLGLGPPGTPPKSLKAFDRADISAASSCKPGDSGHHGGQSSQHCARGDASRGQGSQQWTVGQARTEAPVQQVIRGHREETWKFSLSKQCLFPSCKFVIMVWPLERPHGGAWSLGRTLVPSQQIMLSRNDPGERREASCT